jgi:hypothetical protein
MKIIILLCFIGVGCNGKTQNLKEAEVPAAVKTKFAAMHPAVENVKWEKEDGKYEAEFEANKIKVSELFAANGTHLQTEAEIRVSSLPKGVNEYVIKNLSEKRIKEATKITGANGTITYEADIGNLDYLFDAEGKFIKNEMENNDTEDEDEKQ